jgi:hypothetical protein
MLHLKYKYPTSNLEHSVSPQLYPESVRITRCLCLKVPLDQSPFPTSILVHGFGSRGTCTNEGNEEIVISRQCFKQ